jgi:hypothetical protein
MACGFYHSPFNGCFNEFEGGLMDIKLDSSHDIAIENDDLVLLDGVDAIGQEVSIRLQFFLGEWFLDARVGLPYYEKILGQKPRISVVTSIFRESILSTPGILTVTDLEIDFTGATRALSVSFFADTVEGPLTYDKEFILS